MFPSELRSSARIGGKDAGDDSSEARRVFTDLHTLRGNLVDAWQARAVILTPEERRQLRDEIRQTCSLLEDLVSRA